MTTDIRFPLGPFVGPDGYVTLEWQQWLQNPQVLTIDLAEAVAVTSGGTGITSGTSGGILSFTSTSTIASSGLLGANKIILGGGAGSVPSTPLGLGTTTTILHGNAAGAPTWGAVVLTSDVSGILPATNGGTGVANNAASTITISGNFGLTLTVTGATALTLPTSGTVTALGNATTGTGNIVRQTSPSLVTPALGVADATSLGLAGFFHLATPAAATQTAVSLYAGTGAPSALNGANGDFYFRGDGSAGTFIYQKSAGAWTGIV